MKPPRWLAPSNLLAVCRRLQIDEIDSILLPSTGCVPSTDALDVRLRDWHYIDYSVFAVYSYLLSTFMIMVFILLRIAIVAQKRDREIDTFDGCDPLRFCENDLSNT